MPNRVIVILLRNDLRIHDQEHFAVAHDEAKNADVTHVLPLYVFDERHVELSGLPGYQRQGPEARTRVCGFWRTGVFRLKFMCEAVYDLRTRLRDKGSDLVIRFGKPEDCVRNFVNAIQDRGDSVKSVYVQKEVCIEEVACERALERNLKPLNVAVTYFRQKTLVHHDDLPFAIDQIPDVFTPFRKRVEGLGVKMARGVIPTLERFKPVPSNVKTDDYGSDFNDKDIGEMETLLLKPLAGHVQLRYDPHSKKSAFPFDGGETSALARIDWYFKQGGDPPPAARYKQTRNHLLGHSYSTKLSPFLCIGSISPRLILQYLLEHEAQFGSSQNTYWIQFELLWRDYFLFITEKYGKQLFRLGGFEEITDPKNAAPKLDAWNQWDPKDEKITRWMEGKTGVPFIDANMIELIQSGFMSNRGRQNVASFLTKDLYYDWRIGAEYFESHLIDFEPCANYGNWQYVSGVGNDPRASRQFNPIKQGKDYDIHGSYIKHWLPQLSRVPAARVHVPWLLSAEERQKFSLRENSYPTQPLIEQANWAPHYNRKQHERTKLKGNNAERVRGARDGTVQGRAVGGAQHLHADRQQTPSDRPVYYRSEESGSSSDNQDTGSGSGYNSPGYNNSKNTGSSEGSGSQAGGR